MNGCMENAISSYIERQNDVDVVILCYGNYDKLLLTINSVLEQNAHIGKIILSDDGSGKTFPKEVLNRIAEKTEPIECVVRSNERNIGTVMHMNITAALCSSKYIKFISPGDTFFNAGSLNQLICFAKRYNTPVVTSRAQVCDQTTGVTYYIFPQEWRKKLFQQKDRFFEHLCCDNMISATGSMYRRDFFDVLGGFDSEFIFLEDWPTWLKITRAGFEIPCLWDVTCCYDFGGISSKNGNAYVSLDLRRDMLLCYEKEILPYCEQFKWHMRHSILYRYKRLKGTSSVVLFVRYPIQHAIFMAKFAIKKLLILNKKY